MAVAVKGNPMKVRIQVIIESDSGEQELLEEVASVQRDALRSEDLGLTLAEAKAMLAGVQRTMITAQANAYVAQQRVCPSCGTSYAYKGQHTIVVRTLFGRCVSPARGSMSVAVSPSRRRVGAHWRNVCPNAPCPSCCIWKRNLRP
jgi:hypothetical protein